MAFGHGWPSRLVGAIAMAKLEKRALFGMELHEIKSVPCKSHDIDVMRVIGGWVYTQIGWDTENDRLISSSSCFVPESLNVYAKVGQ